MLSVLVYIALLRSGTATLIPVMPRWRLFDTLAFAAAQGYNKKRKIYSKYGLVQEILKLIAHTCADPGGGGVVGGPDPEKSQNYRVS